MIRIVLFFSLLFVSITLYAKIYQWTDDKGVIHFSDVPHGNSRQIELQEVQTYFPSAAGIHPVKTANYSNPDLKISVIIPQNNATIRNNQGQLIVKISPSLLLGKMDSIVIRIDEQSVFRFRSALQFTLNDIARGEHRLILEVIDSQGNTLTRSEPIVFFMHRPLISKHF